VLFRPDEAWYLEEFIALTVGAQAASGEPIETVTYQFQVESEDQYQVRVSDSQSPLWQPQYEVDFDSSTLDLNAESNASVELTEAAGAAAPVADAVAPPVKVGPEQVYEVPQRVWLPVPSANDPADLRLYYYHANGSDEGWYPAENVEGWLVPGSELQLQLDGAAYIGFLVRHGGIVQLAAQGD
jgi:hypothetical protein